MPRKVSIQKGVSNDPEDRRERAKIDLFYSDSTVDEIANWDLKPEVLQQVILGALANGQAIMFGVGRNGKTVSVALKYDDDPWQRKYVEDGFELVELLDMMASRLPKGRLRAVGD